ncbi:MAG: subclass B1 metallo-beta-lactamase [Saprospiraceae bacterium]|nr:subclass B1 metallo-beta-lactamase [Saprospiraceae bacterium]
MKKTFTSALCMFFLCALAAQKDGDLIVTEISSGYWMHTSYKMLGDAPFPSNGMIAEVSGGVLIVDTGWGKKPTRKLLRWVRRHLHKPVKGLIVSHSHDDRSGGIALFAKKGIPLFMSERSARLLREQGEKLPDYTALPDESTQLGAEVFYPGSGHTSDNIVVYFEEPRILFGGCFVKSRDAKGLGNIADADLKAWPLSLQAVQRRFPDAKIVVPGHQSAGGTDLLIHTLQLLETNGK